jgi:hypothetical protein
MCKKDTVQNNYNLSSSLKGINLSCRQAGMNSPGLINPVEDIRMVHLNPSAGGVKLSGSLNSFEIN